MDLSDLKHIRTMRKQLDWTQKNLAKAVGITQSMVNKIESGAKLPSFETATKIFSILTEQLSHREGKPGLAKDISIKYVIAVKADETIEKAIEKMGTQIDQVPVFEGEICVGSFSNRKLVSLLNEPHFKQKKIKDVMEPPFPMIGEEESLTRVRKLLEIFDTVLTIKEGKITGIITRSDLLKTL